MRKVRCLKPGDTIAIISPASPVEQEDLIKATQIIQNRGYKVLLGKHALDTVPDNSYLAGTDADRAADINEMFAREDVKAIFCARGGYGCMRLFPMINWNLIDANPKIFTGYSDITSLDLGIDQIAKFVTFHGPNATSLAKMNNASTEYFWQLIEYPSKTDVFPVHSANLKCLVPGEAEGTLAGGCISLLAHACGSKFSPHFAGKIVLLEDVNESIYRMDRYLVQLRNAGAFDQVAGFILGNVTNWQKEEKTDMARPNSLNALWQEFFLPIGKPTISGFPFGHEPNPSTLPLGGHVILDATHCTVTLTENVTVN